MVGGYAGKVLEINLSNGRVREEPLDLSLAKSLIGCLGVASKIMLERIDRYVDPLSPENKLIFATGVLTGSTAPAASKSIVISRSPLTNIWGESVFSANSGIELKRAGYDMLLVDGKAEKPVYLWIHDGSVEIRDASGIWGMDTFTACESIKRDLGERRAAVVSIGPAGERLVRLSSIISDNGRAAGRCGLGAVMGSKNLKAIAIRGTKDVTVAKPDEFLEFVKEFHERMKGPATKKYRTLGTPENVLVHNALHCMPTRNYNNAHFEAA
ncbi:MAG: aldehyde ferredoxin oxidoreductase N-terminal domain-containing protein, partial [Candidatus Bathyarchaeia archaeon]